MEKAALRPVGDVRLPGDLRDGFLWHLVLAVPDLPGALCDQGSVRLVSRFCDFDHLVDVGERYAGCAGSEDQKIGPIQARFLINIGKQGVWQALIKHPVHGPLMRAILLGVMKLVPFLCQAADDGGEQV